MEVEIAFEALTGHPMLPWQRRLLGRLRAGDIPDAIDLPTGLGKTTVIAIWLIALALGAPVGRRLVYIVDRRAVVDQATRLADEFAAALSDPGSSEADKPPKRREALVALRSALQERTGGELVVSTLRGQHADNRLWLIDPSRVAIVVGTVDMIGSRLLFSGYRVSRRTRSMHAALLARDSLVALDESHLVPAFKHLLGELSRFVKAEPSLVQAPPMHLLRLSATDRDDESRSFGLDQRDRDHPWIRARLEAPKRLALSDAPRQSLPDVLAERAFELAGESARVVIFCDRLKDLNKVIAALEKRWKSDPARGKAAAPIARLSGQVRVLERATLTDNVVFRRFIENEPGTGPAFLAATSAGEVGVDYDAQHMVCDLVAWERMVQRLGRVNRAGRAEPAFVDVVAVSDEDKVDDGRRVPLWRKPFESKRWNVDDEQRRDASLAMLEELGKNERFATLCREASSEESYRPPFSAALVDAWSMTSTESHSARPAVEPWLRGWQENEEPEATLVWRRWLPPETRANDYLRDAPVHLLETLSAPIGVVRGWLADIVKRVDRALKDAKADPPALRSLAHVLAASPDLPVAIIESAIEVRVLTWQDLKEEIARAAAQRRLPAPGTTLIVDSRFGGLASDGSLDGNAAHMPLTWDSNVPETDPDASREPIAAVEPNDSETPRKLAEAETDPDPGSELFRRIPYLLRRGRTTVSSLKGHFRLPYRDVVNEDVDEPRGFWIERLASSEPGASVGVEQTLQAHHDWVLAETERLCETLKINGQLLATLRLAARWHDAGKSRARWQRAMGAHTTGDGVPLAKTRGGVVPRLLDGYRHEFGSVRDLSESDELDALSEAMKDLALHLVASHHGWARPGIRALDPDEPPPLERSTRSDVEMDAEQVALRFARVQRQHGHYALAWLESVLRAADWSASRRLDEEGADADRV